MNVGSGVCSPGPGESEAEARSSNNCLQVSPSSERRKSPVGFWPSLNKVLGISSSLAGSRSEEE